MDMFEMDLSETLIINIGRDGYYGNVRVRIADLPAHVRGFVFEYGIRQILNDAVSDKRGLEDWEVAQKAQDKYEQLVAGQTRMRSEPTNPLDAEIWRIARANIIVLMKRLKVWPKGGSDKFQRAIDARRKARGQSPMDADDYIQAYIEANLEMLKPKAEAELERKRSEAASLAELDFENDYEDPRDAADDAEAAAEYARDFPNGHVWQVPSGEVYDTLADVRAKHPGVPEAEIVKVAI